MIPDSSVLQFCPCWCLSFCPMISLLIPSYIYSSIFFLSPSKVPVLKPTDLMVEVRPRRVFSNGHTYHVNSISVNSDGETYLSADDLRINMWHLGITDRSFSILSVCFYKELRLLSWAQIHISGSHTVHFMLVVWKNENSSYVWQMLFSFIIFKRKQIEQLTL